VKRRVFVLSVVWGQAGVELLETPSCKGGVMSYEIEVKELEPEKLAGVRSHQTIAELGSLMGREFGHIMAVMSRQGLYPVGPPMAVYHSWTADSVDVEIGFPIEGDLVEEDGVVPSTLPAGRVATTTYMGPYDQVHVAYAAIQAWAQEHQFELADMMWERYLTSPEEEPDLSKHLTLVYWPLR